MEIAQLKTILEAAILAAGEPVSVERLSSLFPEEQRPSKSLLKQALAALEEDYLERGIRLQRVANGYIFHTPSQLGEWIKGLWPEKRPRYTRAFLETLAIIAYKQPVTRGDIEAIRGVAVSPNIIKILLDQEWIESVGQREVPGRPNLYATTKQFLDHFNLKALAELPVLPALNETLMPMNTDEQDIKQIIQPPLESGAIMPAN
ncbi:SMC-Scp complex subunit ScpB [Rickettsiella endosymbiont of Dermanyssus gallinae]|uniref:SMC-Scp complex subunit ScpB n=1 Tax=Rickettsiella endosymbiont of Dermanyssus gallinae TaxID=2856608 RepID=UPI001C5323A3|nr:SMC-Scp complex subunit ScpB [Rickettsiella endosymbiont of Dermanyssus gallinae]